MTKKILSVLGSIRFWIVTFAWLATYLGIVQQDGFSWISLFDQMAKWLGTVVAIGTLDKVAYLFGTK